MSTPRLSLDWSMPNHWTFQMRPVREFLERHLVGCDVIVDPFCGRSTIGTHRNDLADGGIDADKWCEDLADQGVIADAVIFDPPYSPRQIKECYRQIGRECGQKDTQGSALNRRVREPLSRMLRPGGIALSFGWQSTGFGSSWKTEEILLVRHGGGHNDTICVAQRKPE